jgi:tRNA threonylcarbamoyladenosine biosynthesis protein TsaB
VLILAFESSAKCASVALWRDGVFLAQSLQCSGLTHSTTLLPMAVHLLEDTSLTVDNVDVIAVAHGPGSFTGVRIGVATVKGMAWGANKPVCGVSTLEALAWLGASAPAGALVCPVMDARRSEVYNALFIFEDGAPKRLCPDRAISLGSLSYDLRHQERPVFLLGDGAELAHKFMAAEGIDAVLPPMPQRYQSAWGVALAAKDKQPVSADDLIPVYLRLSQAERERQAAAETVRYIKEI